MTMTTMTKTMIQVMCDDSIFMVRDLAMFPVHMHNWLNRVLVITAGRATPVKVFKNRHVSGGESPKL
jgi:hypothetical protein